MKIKRLVLGTTVLAMTFFCAGRGFGQASVTIERQWAYQFVNCDERELNLAGRDGWEAVSVIHNEGSCRYVLLKRIGTKTSAPVTASVPVVPKCNLTLKDAPVIRGLKLGMKLDELYQSFPTLRYDSEVQRVLAGSQNYPHFGRATFSLNLGNILPLPATLNDLQQINLTLQDDELIGYDILYKSDRSQHRWNQTNWLAKLIATYQLPNSSHWENINEQNPYSTAPASLKCRDFSVQVQISSPSVSVYNTINNVAEQRALKLAEQKREAFKP